MIWGVTETSTLKWTLCGSRDASGTIGNVGAGYVWSSSDHGPYARFLTFSFGPTLMFSSDRAVGMSVRCLREEKQEIEQQEIEQQEIEQNAIYDVVDDQPNYPGGERARQQFLRDNLIYPELAREAGIQGTVYVTFVVERDGSITNIHVLRGIGGGCDEEAVRLVGIMPRWEPARKRGQPVRYYFNMPIRFRFD